MGSFNEAQQAIEYKSGLELKSFKYVDANPSVVKFSVEPFPIKYVKPTTGKIHRYFPDLYIEFKSGVKFIVEIKSSGETKAPVQPKKLTPRTERSYRKSLETWAINSAKWKACGEFCKEHGFKFTFLTERELG